MLALPTKMFHNRSTSKCCHDFRFFQSSQYEGAIKDAEGSLQLGDYKDLICIVQDEAGRACSQKTCNNYTVDVIDQGVWGRLTWISARVVDGMGLCVPACGRGMFLHAWLVGCWLPQQRTGTYWHNLTQSTLDFETTMPAFSLTYAKGWRQDKDRGQNFNPQTVCGLRMRKISGHLQQHLWILVVCCCSLIWCLL